MRKAETKVYRSIRVTKEVDEFLQFLVRERYCANYSHAVEWCVMKVRREWR